MKKSSGFAIVELLIIIIIIGALSALMYGYYSNSLQTGGQKGQTKTATEQANDVSLQSDLTNAVSQLKLYQAANDNFPDSIDCSSSPAPNSICLKASADNKFTYVAHNDLGPKNFELTATNKHDVSYKVTNDITPQLITK